MSSSGEDPKPPRDELFQKVFDDHWAAVRHHVEGVVSDDGQVTEIVSEVFLRAWTHLDVRRPPDRIWLLRTADGILRDHPHGHGAASPHVAAVPESLGGGEADDAERVVAVRRALAVLRPRDRRIIMLTYWDGLSVGEIAELWRRPQAIVRRRLARAEMRLRAALTSEGVIVDD